MSDYLHNLIQFLAIMHAVATFVAGVSALGLASEGDALWAKRFALVFVGLAAPLPFSAAWLMTYGGVR